MTTRSLVKTSGKGTPSHVVGKGGRGSRRLGCPTVESVMEPDVPVTVLA
jgi:hypothetical protein